MHVDFSTPFFPGVWYSICCVIHKRKEGRRFSEKHRDCRLHSRRMSLPAWCSVIFVWCTVPWNLPKSMILFSRHSWSAMVRWEWSPRDPTGQTSGTLSSSWVGLPWILQHLWCSVPFLGSRSIGLSRWEPHRPTSPLRRYLAAALSSLWADLSQEVKQLSFKERTVWFPPAAPLIVRMLLRDKNSAAQTEELGETKQVWKPKDTLPCHF